MTKKYFSRTCLSLSVNIAPGRNRRVSFDPLTTGGSVFYTDDPELQQALEHHRYYNAAFAEQPMPEAAPEPEADEAPQTSASNTIKVSSLDEAKDYLSETHGVSRTKMRNAEAVRAAAASFGVTFEGI